MRPAARFRKNGDGRSDARSVPALRCRIVGAVIRAWGWFPSAAEEALQLWSYGKEHGVGAIQQARQRLTAQDASDDAKPVEPGHDLGEGAAAGNQLSLRIHDVKPRQRIGARETGSDVLIGRELRDIHPAQTIGPLAASIEGNF